MTRERCAWCGTDPLYLAYHDREWGVPVHDDRRLFEMLVLEGAQAGLNWLTILRKREHYRRAFDDFDPERIACYDEGQIARLLADPGIVRNRRKIEAAIDNARGCLTIRERHGGLGPFLWRYVDFSPRRNAWRSLAEVPARTAEAEAMSRDLKRLGFAFVGPTICYAFMQAVGMVNDHAIHCFRHRELS
jgi:DNA-3-methyladenine glycosylase I